MTLLADTPQLACIGGLELAARRVVEGLRSGRHRSPFLGPAVEFADHRPYQPGDDLRLIDWKVAARTDRLLVRRHREERDLPLVLVLDTSASLDWSDAGRPTKRTWAVLAAAALALLAGDQGDRVRVVAGARTLERFSAEQGGPVGAAAALRQLEDLPVQAAGDLPAVLDAVLARLTRKALIVILSDFLVEIGDFAAALARLSARGHDLAAIRVLDPAELALPAEWGRCALSDPEGATPPLTCDAAEAKAHFDRAMAAHGEALAQACAAARTDWVTATTGQDQAEVLGHWLHRRAIR